MPSEPLNIDVAVVGGGISGVYSAWRLSSSPNPPTVALLESAGHLGGRIDSVPLPNSKGEPQSGVELGAMRFMPFMTILKSLLSHLDLQTETFPCNTPRGTFLRDVDIQFNSQGIATNSPYRLGSGEPQSYFELAMRVLNGAVPNAASLTPQQWRDVTLHGMFKGRELWRWGMHSLAQELISNEAFRFLYAGLGLDSVLLRTNAAMGLRALAAPLPDYLAGKVFRPVNGFSSLVGALEKSLLSAPSCSIYKGHRLCSVTARDNGIQLVFETSTGMQEVNARQVVLAMPRRAVELIDMDGLFPAGARDTGRVALDKKLGGVEGVPSFKLFAVYDKPWWQTFVTVAGQTGGWQTGYSVTDLPLRQVFFGIGHGPDTTVNQNVLMASYSDSDTARYWEGLADVSDSLRRSGPTSQFQQVQLGSNLLTAVDRQLRALSQNVGPLPPPILAGYVNWQSDPFGGAWHEWKPGINVTTAIPDMRQPVPGLPLYLCGEAYSWFQAWIEGALMSAENMLQEKFHLPWPKEWLPTDYDLGP